MVRYHVTLPPRISTASLRRQKDSCGRNPNGIARLLSVNVGLPRDIVWKGRRVHTGIWKHPVRGCCRVGRLNLQGDGQGDLAGHGREHRAVFVYQIESYHSIGAASSGHSRVDCRARRSARVDVHCGSGRYVRFCQCHRSLAW